MDAALTISIIIAFLAILIIVFSVESTESFAAGAGILMLDIVVGFGIFCGLFGIDGKAEYIRPDEIYRSKDTVFIKINNRIISSEKYSMYVLKDDEIWVKKTPQINSYDGKVGEEYELTTKEK